MPTCRKHVHAGARLVQEVSKVKCLRGGLGSEGRSTTGRPGKLCQHNSKFFPSQHDLGSHPNERDRSASKRLLRLPGSMERTCATGSTMFDVQRPGRDRRR